MEQIYKEIELLSSELNAMLKESEEFKAYDLARKCVVEDEELTAVYNALLETGIKISEGNEKKLVFETIPEEVKELVEAQKRLSELMNSVLEEVKAHV